MAETYDGDARTFYRHRGRPVVNAAGPGLLPFHPGGTISVNGTVTQVREIESGVLVSTVQTGSDGEFPDVYVPLGDPDNDVVTIDWPEDDISRKTLDLHPNEERQLNRALAESAGAAAAQQASESADAAAEARQAAATAVALRPATVLVIRQNADGSWPFRASVTSDPNAFVVWESRGAEKAPVGAPYALEFDGVDIDAVTG